MKPGGATAVSSTHLGNFEHDKTRKTLHTLQPAATDKENLVGGGRVLRSGGGVPLKGAIKDEMSEKTKIETTKKIKSKSKYLDKAIQTIRGGKAKIDIEDLICDAGPSENYWQILAERRRIALDDALEENKELNERVVKLEEENRICKDMLDETRALVEVLQEMIGEDRSDINNSLDDSRL
ncbi:hypothetical protein PV325_002306 [Microctonus aethiopoides]|uniref:Geminin n=1 Tax=Microctonus aethiopoides TaxID=144406 RepID=A0AA39CA25_9HYME|nr:hypothetical protein PV325_002306 [Microctonus aethiopoides]KAK0091469.1 hypothetical protein PV326_003183 [Microctonus aethiopoides]KAK0160613.1 hypothetical protein PV328_008005 [Microctonus aethiopoides]